MEILNIGLVGVLRKAMENGKKALFQELLIEFAKLIKKLVFRLKKHSKF